MATANDATAVWNPEIRDNFLRQKNAAKSVLNTTLGEMEAQLTAMAAADSSSASRAQNQYNSKKPTIEEKLVALQTLNQSLETKLGAMDVNQLKFQIAAKKDEIAEIQNDRDEKQTLAGLRKEQADALTAKYDSNYHSSWLGLWRPMSQQSQYGLSFFAGLFGFMAVAILGWMGWSWFSEGTKGVNKTSVGGAVPAANAGKNNFGLGAL